MSNLATLSAVAFAVLAAGLFGLNAVIARRTVGYVDAQIAAMLTIGTAAALTWLLSPLFVEAAWWGRPGMWVFLVNGLFHPTLSLLLAYEATRRIGATMTATISATTPLFAAAGAVAALGEPITLPLVAGILAVVGGIVVLVWRPNAVRGWALAAVAFPTGAALVRAVNMVFGKFGLGMLPEPYFAAMLSFTVAATLHVSIYRLRHGHLPLRLPRAGVLYGMASGATLTGAILSMYNALGAGFVAVVSPVIATYPLFAGLFSLLVGDERFQMRMLGGVVLVVGGVVWITLQ